MRKNNRIMSVSLLVEAYDIRGAAENPIMNALVYREVPSFHSLYAIICSKGLGSSLNPIHKMFRCDLIIISS